MKYTTLGRTGVTVSRLCLGCMSYGSSTWRPWILDGEDAARPFFRAAVEGGINFFDTADGYSLGRSEVITGKMLKEFAVREEIVLATKVFFPMGPGPNMKGLSRKHVVQACEASLARLGVEAVDLVEVDRLDAEATKAGLAPFEDVLAGQALHVGAPPHGEEDLRREDGLLAPGELPQHLPGDLLRPAERVAVGRVEEVDPGLRGRAEEGTGGLLAVEDPGAPRARAVAHAAEAESRDGHAGPAERRVLHRASPLRRPARWGLRPGASRRR